MGKRARSGSSPVAGGLGGSGADADRGADRDAGCRGRRYELALRVVGLGCLLAWTFVTFFNGLIHYSFRGSLLVNGIEHLNYAYASWCCGIVAVSVLGVLPWRRICARVRGGVSVSGVPAASVSSAPPAAGASLSDDTLELRVRLMRRCELVAGVLCILFTAALAGSERGFPGYPWCEASAFGAGMAFGVLFWSWATVYVSTIGRYVGACYGAAFAVGTVLYLLCLYLPELAGIVVCALLAPASVACLRLLPVPRSAMELRRAIPHRSKVVFARALVAIALLGFAESFMRAVFQDPAIVVDTPLFRWLMAGSIAAAALVIAVAARTRPGKDTVGRVNRVLMLVIGLLFLLSPAVWGLGAAADALMVACYGLLYLFVWTLLTQIASAYSLNARIAFCFGLGVAFAGCLLGTFVGSVIMSSGIPGYRVQIVLALGCACLVFVSFLFVADDRTFVELLNADSENPSAPRRFQLRCERIAQVYGLTAKEAEVMTLVAKGRSAQRIQEALDVSASTVNTHINHIYRKMDVHSRQEMLDLLEG